MLRRLSVRGAKIASHWRIMWCRLLYPDVRIGRGCTLAKGVSLRAHDGGTIVLGDGVTVGAHATLVAQGGRLHIGENALISPFNMIVSCDSVVIGADALFAEHVTVRDQDHVIATTGIPYRLQGRTCARVAIGQNVWLGAKVTVTKGVSICDHCVIGSNAVVTRSLVDGRVFVGVPARRIR